MIPVLDDYRQRVRELRRTASMTQAEAATAADVSQSFVAKVERGDITPSYDRAARLFNVLEAAVKEDVKTAADLRKDDIIAANPDDTVAETTARMKENGYSQLPVMEDGQSVGSVSSRGLLNADPDAAIRDHMEPPFPEIAASTPRDAVIELLRSERAVIVRDGTDIAGIITAADVL